MKTLYHYSYNEFEKFDLSKCDGIWLTDIPPTDSDMLEEIGASSCRFVAVCSVDICDDERLLNGDNYDVEEQLENSKMSHIHNIYDGFEDFGFSDDSRIKITEWREV